jgi:hypothetical protein
MCTYYQYVTSCARIIGMSLNVHTVSVLHIMYTHYKCHFTCTLSVCNFTCTYWYVTSHAHTFGMSPHMHILLVCHFVYMYYQYVTSFAHTINVVLKQCPYSSVSKFVVVCFCCHISRVHAHWKVSRLHMQSINVSCSSLSVCPGK